SAVNGYPYEDEEDFASRFEAIFKAAEAEGLDQAVALTMDLPFFVPAECDADTVRMMRTMVKENFDTWSKHQELYMWPSPPAIQRLSEIQVPTLVIVGDHDVTDIVGVAHTLAGQIAGARKAVIHGAGHHVNMEQPEQFYRAVTGLLKNL
ncbi:MAG: alpha/beta fold hydrolase, partial [Planctomycetota bacterium]